MRTCPLFVLLVLLSGCGASTPPPENPEPEQVDPTDDVKWNDTPSNQGADSVAADVSDSNSSKPGAENSIPEDYSMLQRDCIQLRRQRDALMRSEFIAQVDPKITGKQREQAEQNIAAGVSKNGEKWLEACEKLVGQIVDRNSLKCAIAAKTVKDFDNCMGSQTVAP